MSKLSVTELSEKYSDLLKELGNIGAGNATSALSQMMGMKLDMDIPDVRLLEFKDVGSAMGGADQVMVGIYLLAEGDINGSMMFMLGTKSARNLVNVLMGTPDNTSEELTEIELSVKLINLRNRFF